MAKKISNKGGGCVSTTVQQKQVNQLVCALSNISGNSSIEYDGCYVTPGGRVYIKGFAKLSPDMYIESGLFYVKDSTDSSIPIESEIHEISEEWIRVECYCECD